MGDLGGVLELIIVSFGLLFAPISRYSFLITAAGKLFYSRTSDNNLFNDIMEERT